MDTFGNDLGMGGQVLSRDELIKKRERNGECPTCGQKLFKKKLFKLEPVTVPGKVLNGRCLSCNPQDPTKGEELIATCAVSGGKPTALDRGLGRASSRNLMSRGGSGGSGGSGGMSGGRGGRGPPGRSNTTRDVSSSSSSGGSGKGDRNRSTVPPTGGRGLSNIAGVAPRRVASSRPSGGMSASMGPGTSSRAVAGSRKGMTFGFRTSSMGDIGEGGDLSEDGEEDEDEEDVSQTSPPQESTKESSRRERKDRGERGDKKSSRRDRERRDRGDRGERRGKRGNAPPRDALDHTSGTNRSSESDRSNSYLNRETQRPSLVLLDGANIEELDIGDTDGTARTAGSAYSRLTSDERRALQSLNDDGVSYLDIVNIMLVNSISPAVQNEGLHALSLIHDLSQRVLEECAESCGFEVIVSAMGKCSKDAMAQTNACKVLFMASASSESIQMAIGHAGAIEALVDTMKEFHDDSIVLEGCLLALSNICIPEENLVYAVEGEMIELTVNAMSQNVENCGLQEHGCSVLANLAVHGDARPKITDCGGCDAVVVSMVVNPMDVAVQSQALVALRNLCVKDDENKVRLANAGAIDVVIQAMQNHRDDAQIQSRGSWVLGIIGSNEDNKLYIGENGGLDVIVRSMWVHAQDMVVQEKACRALWTLSVPPQNRHTMVEVDGIAAIIAAMQNHAENPIIQERGCGTMCNLAANDDKFKVQIVDEGALEVIVMAMVLHGEDDNINERAVALLHKLCMVPENISCMVAANVSPMMAVVADSFPECQEKASYVLTQLQEA